MLRFKQFLMESVVTNIGQTRDFSKMMRSAYGSRPPSAVTFTPAEVKTGSVDVYTAVQPRESGNRRIGSYRRIESPTIPGIQPFDAIQIYTNNPRQVGVLGSPEESAARHEFQHRLQADAQRQSGNPMSSNRNSQKYKNIQGVTRTATEILQSSGQNSPSVADELSYTLDRQEVGARRIQAGGDAQIRMDRLARGTPDVNPAIRDFEVDLEISGGKTKIPEFNPIKAARNAAQNAYRAEKTAEQDFLKTADWVSNPNNPASSGVRQSDRTRVATDYRKAQKKFDSAVGAALQDNIPNAASEAQEKFEQRVTTPIRERQARVARTAADVEAAKRTGLSSMSAVGMPSDPIAQANFAMDVAGMMGQSTLRSDQVRQAAASLNNPMFSDSEQMMGDAILRGGGEDYQVDPTFLRMADQRAKDRAKERSK